MARDGHARTTGHDQHRPGIVGCVVTRSVSATAKTGYSVRINFENMLRLAQAVSSCALWRSVDLEPVAPRTIIDDDLGVLWPATCRTRS